MAHVLIAKGNADALYGSTYADPATEEAAYTPNLLANGAIGVYGLNKVDGTTAANNDKECLLVITNTGAGITADSDFAGDWIYIAQGLGGGAFTKTGPIQVSGIQSIVCKDYSAPVKQEVAFGYNEDLDAGSCNLPATIAAGDGILLKMVRYEEGTNDRTPMNFFLNATASESQYSILSRLAAQIDEKGKAGQFISRVKIHEDSGTADPFDTSGTVALTYGSTSATTSAAHGVDVGDYVALDDDLYQAVTGTTGSTLILDRPWLGATTAALANASTSDLGATIPTELGLAITAYDYNQKYALAAEGILEDGTIAEAVSPQVGIGYGPDVVAMERKEIAYRGALDTVDANVTIPQITADATASYNMMFIDYINSHGDRTGHKPSSEHRSQVTIAFIDEAQTATYNMADTMTILATLFTATETIS